MVFRTNDSADLRRFQRTRHKSDFVIANAGSRLNEHYAFSRSLIQIDVLPDAVNHSRIGFHRQHFALWIPRQYIKREQASICSDIKKLKAVVANKTGYKINFDRLGSSTFAEKIQQEAACLSRIGYDL